MKMKTKMKKLPKEVEAQFPEEIQIFRKFVFDNCQINENEMQKNNI